MAKPGYGKRSAPDQQARTQHDFALLPTRERYVAGFIDHLPEGAAMSVKTLAKQLPLYGQQAVSTSLTGLSVAGHLRRVRCPVGAGDETRCVFRTFWSRTARDNEWWNTYLATEDARAARPAPGVTASATAAPPPPWVPVDGPPPPALPEESREEAAPESPEPPHADAAPRAAEPAEAPAPTSVPHQRTPAGPPDTAPAPGPAHTTAPATGPTAPTALHSPAYLALARLGRTDQRLALSADDCAALETGAAAWFARGVDADYLTAALTAGLPARVDSPVGFVRRRLTDKIPPRLPVEHAPPDAPVRRVLMECTDCGVPGRPEALRDGLCRPCRAAHHAGSADYPVGTARQRSAPATSGHTSPASATCSRPLEDCCKCALCRSDHRCDDGLMSGAPRIVPKDEAVGSAEAFLQQIAYPDRADSIVMRPDTAREFTYGWTVCFDFKEHIETGDFTQAPFSPVIVVPHDRSAAHFAPTFPPTEEYMVLQASGNWPPRKGR